ncbi:S-adenosyl-L-methionine-dependent methyltransferase [Aspergillus heteromorphus CBS 117.55]|uniref:S-adenosyl-L-methionine-dependent methyltransferase n=1 Tax=Aspergillus heteromorphus CBS 117.55 TaxID=1448321 RepID=A0A317WRW0_9EURO|nr:S-adenosyl-L-methionine-dependent methyltransferase [Aspergillus heteromorphus CBS 117.55]PWY89193.1 S-adenosyl-L-methionine-dependent methyltransferase [Aspergillus heteromorphus CBS 117.55]
MPHDRSDIGTRGGHWAIFAILRITYHPHHGIHAAQRPLVCRGLLNIRLLRPQTHPNPPALPRPQPTDRILDIGCGDGKFTALFVPAIAHVLGVDSSPAMIAAANADHGSPKAEFRVLDCCFLDRDGNVTRGGWDKVISNAALHWILRNEETRISTLRGIHASLKPDGVFVFEMGGHGNVAEVQSALIYALVQRGVPLEEARAINPWFFPSVNWMTAALEGIGFQVEKMEMEDRPTRLTEEANGGLAGWVRLMGAPFLEVLPEGEREGVVRQVCEVLHTAVTRVEDGSQWLGYKRLRGIARRV